MRFLTLVAAFVVASPAYADTPSVVYPPFCTVPSQLILVGTNGTYGDIAGSFSVIVRDGSNIPMENCQVDVSFADVPYARICNNQPAIGLTLSCPNRTLRLMSNAGGSATFRVIGSASPEACSADPPGRVSVYACGVLIGTATVAVLDLDGDPGLSGGDLSEWLGGFLCGSTSPRLDYDGDGVVGGGDLSVWLAFFNGGGSAFGCTTGFCP